MKRPAFVQIAAIVLLAGVSVACAATAQREPSPLTAEGLRGALAACHAPPATLSDGGEHLSIVFPNGSADPPGQSLCLFEWVHAHGFWVDQIVHENASNPAS